jgi:hypothetical protein
MLKRSSLLVRLVMLLGVLSLVAVAGCGSSTSTVGGKVQLDGAPVADADIAFHPPPGKGSSFHGRTGSDGAFTLQPGADKKGPPPGQYKVTVSRYIQADGKAPPADDVVMLKLGGKLKNSLPHIYEDAEKTPLSAEVKSGVNDIPVALKKTP